MFLVFFFTLYSLMHFYVYRKAKKAFPQVVHPIPAIIFSCIMMFGPIGVRMLDSAGHHGFARFISPAVHAWMAIAFWFVVAAAAIDFWNLFARVLLRRILTSRKLGIGPKPAFLTVASLVVIASTWGVYKVSRR